MHNIFHQSTIRYCDKEGNKTLFSEVQADIDCTQVIPRKRGDKDYDISNCIVISSWIIRRCRDFIYSYTTSRKVISLCIAIGFNTMCILGELECQTLYCNDVSISDKSLGSIQYNS